MTKVNAPCRPLIIEIKLDAAVRMIGYFIFYGTYLLTYAILGLMGAYLSNLLTKEDFLFVWGGPYFRYLFYNLLARPVIGAFSAVFFFLVEKSKLIFSINPIVKGESAPVQPNVYLRRF